MPRALAVGWLGFFTFRLGATPARFRALLGELCRRPPAATQTPGAHPCRLGTCLWRWLLHNRVPPGRPLRVYAGSAEVLVPGRDGKVYCAPALIGHYVTGHRYRSPTEFVEAVLALDGPGGLRRDVIERLTKGPDR